LYNGLCHYFRGRGRIILYVASLGIASLLLPGGRMAYSRFGIPLYVNKSSTYLIPKDGQLADLLRQTSLLI